jgi:chaperone modulatory protein CbpM
MNSAVILQGVVLEDAALSVHELALACAVEPDWVTERVEAGLLTCVGSVRLEWRFASTDLLRARRLVELERKLDANPEVAALVVDLMEEVGRLRAQLNAAGI